MSGALNAVLLVGGGAADGAVLRWLLGMGLNSLFPDIPMGTLAANLLGGYLAGIAMEVLAAPRSLAPELRLLLMTGFLGGLTTFSTFSAEVVRLMQRGRLGMAGAEIAVHVVGSLLLTLLGVATVIATRRLLDG